MSNLEIAKLYKRIHHLENINNVKNEDHYTYKIDDFGIICLNHIVIDKNYSYIKSTSPIYITFSGYLISNGTVNLTFRANILDDNGERLHSIDKNIDFSISHHSIFHSFEKLYFIALLCIKQNQTGYSIRYDRSKRVNLRG